MRQLVHQLGRVPIAFVACLALAVIVLLPGLGGPGLWEPQERQLADRLAPPAELADPPPSPPRPPTDDDCDRTPPEDAAARTLTKRAMVWGRDTFGDTDGGRRLPLALLGILTVLAAAGTAMRGGGGRAGLVTGVVLLAMPLLVLQSRLLTSDIGSACGGALVVYALMALAHPVQRRPWLAVDLLLATVTLVAGLVIGFYGGGALFGWLVPLGAVAAAGSLGVPFFVGAARGRPALSQLPAVVATLAALGVLVLLAYQLYELKTPYPGLTPPPARQMFGKAIVPEGCWSWALGATWRPEDDLRYVFDSTFEQIAYGTYPWGALAPIAMFALLRDEDPRRRVLGAVTLAWAGGAWIAAEAFQRKAGFTIYAGFPALAIAIGVWVEGVIARRLRGEEGLRGGAAILIALFVALAALDFGKDLQSFTERLTSLLVGTDGIPYPKDAELGVKLKLWVLVLGVLPVVAGAIGLAVWRPGEAGRVHRLVSALALAGALAGTLILAAFWSFGWQPTLSKHLSSKELLQTYNELRSPSAPEPLFVMGDLGHAPAAYTDTKPQPLPSRDQIVAALKRAERVFAIAPQAELCALHREMGDKPYYVVDARNVRSLLFSNQLAEGAVDQNPLSNVIVHKVPEGIQKKPKARIVWDNRIELIGWDIPDRVRAGDSFEVVTYYKILSPVGGAWTMLLHFDGPVRLRDGDHKPINDRCPTSTWMPGDYIIDRHTMTSAGHPNGKYELNIGFFTGSAPNFRNMPVTSAPADQRDTTDRVKITSLIID